MFNIKWKELLQVLDEQEEQYRMQLKSWWELPDSAKEPYQQLQILQDLEVTLLLKKAVKKQIPTTPKIESWNPALCPCCETELSDDLGDGYYSHNATLEICPYCGQKLDWD